MSFEALIPNLVRQSQRTWEEKMSIYKPSRAERAQQRALEEERRARAEERRERAAEARERKRAAARRRGCAFSVP